MSTKNRVTEVETSIDVRKIKVKRFGKTFEIYPWLKGRLFHKMITGHETFQKKDLSLYLKQILSLFYGCLLYTSPSPRDRTRSRMPSSA